MYIKKIREIVSVVGHVCDACGQDCHKDGDYMTTETASFSANWGFFSDKDGVVWECDLCEPCADRVKEFIETTLKGKVKTNVE